MQHARLHRKGQHGAWAVVQTPKAKHLTFLQE